MSIKMRVKYPKYILNRWILVLILVFSFNALQAQDSTSFWEKGHLYGQFFGDYFYKSHADSLQRGEYQYSGLSRNSNAFQIRRIQLGYEYQFSPKFTADVLMESVGENGGMTFFIKYANLRWKEIYPGADLVVGRTETPTFATTGKLWGYRSVERSLSDMQGSSSYDLGVVLDGRFDKSDRLGYRLMIGNGEGNSLTDNRFKKFYGEVYARLADKKLVLDAYADYERFYWQPGFHQSAQMFKAAVAYQFPGFTVGVEAYTQNLKNSVAVQKAVSTDTLDARSFAVSAFIHGSIVKDKLSFFLRSDHLNPMHSNGDANRIISLMEAYDPVNKMQFFTGGLDYSPVKRVHFQPNIWYVGYKNRLTAVKDYDLVYRLTFFYKFEG